MLLRHCITALFLPLVSKSPGHAFADFAAREQEQWREFILRTDITRRTADLIFREKSKKADVILVQRGLWQIQRQHIQREVAAGQLLHVIF